MSSGRRVPGTDPPQPAADDVELGEHRRDEALLGELPADGLVHGRVGRGEVEAAAAAVAVRRDREGGGARRRQAMTHRVEDREVQEVLVVGVVEGVAAVVVAGLEHPGDDQAVGGEDQRRRQLPQQLGGDRHLAPAADDLEDVAVVGLRDDGLRQEVRQALPQLDRARGNVTGPGPDRDLDHPQALGAVEQRQPQAAAVRRLAGGAVDRAGAEAAPGDGPVDGQRVAHGDVLARDRHEHPLLVVDEVEDEVLAPGAPCLLRRHLREVGGGAQVGAAQDLREELRGDVRVDGHPLRLYPGQRRGGPAAPAGPQRGAPPSSSASSPASSSTGTPRRSAFSSLDAPGASPATT